MCKLCYCTIHLDPPLQSQCQTSQLGRVKTLPYSISSKEPLNKSSSAAAEAFAPAMQFKKLETADFALFCQEFPPEQVIRHVSGEVALALDQAAVAHPAAAGCGDERFVHGNRAGRGENFQQTEIFFLAAADPL